MSLPSGSASPPSPPRYPSASGPDRCFPYPLPTYTYHHNCASLHHPVSTFSHLSLTNLNPPAYIRNLLGPGRNSNFLTCTAKTTNYYHCASSGCKLVYFRPAWICWVCDGYNPLVTRDGIPVSKQACIWCKAVKDGSSVAIWVMKEEEVVTGRSAEKRINEVGVWGGLRGSVLVDEAEVGGWVRVLRTPGGDQLGWHIRKHTWGAEQN